MPANEFEKNMQQKMGELKLTPSDEVWTEVELRIRKEKKKRRAFVWLFLLFLMLGGGVATILLTNNKNNHIVQSKEPINNLQPNLSSTQKQSISETSSIKDNDKKTITQKNKSADFNIKEYSNDQKNESLINNERFFKKKNKQVKNNQKGLIQPQEKEINSNINVTDRSDQKNNESVIEDKINQPVNQQKDTTSSKEIGLEKIKNKRELQSSDQSLKDSIANVVTEQKKPIHVSKRKSKWQWGILLQKGESQTAKGLQFTGSSVVADNLYANGSSNTPGANPNPAAPSAKHPAGSFALGVFTKKTVSSRLDVNFVLNYLYLSTKMTVGKKVDSAAIINNSSSFLGINNYYRTASNSNSSYTNRYHFLSLSAELSWKVINGKKLNIYWNNGVSYNRLLSSNALNYDRNLQGYYKDFGLLTHNHFFLSTGLSVPVFKRFDLNPFAEYSLTPVLRHSGSTRTHFSNYGMRIRFSSKK